MPSEYIPEVKKADYESAAEVKDDDLIYDLLTQPLHEELFRRQTFAFYDQLNPGQQWLIGFDYVRTQVKDGGFIQFLDNGYVSLLPDLVAGFKECGAQEMAQLLDDVLKVYVLNHKYFDDATDVASFAKLYDELKEFEALDEKFAGAYIPSLKMLIEYAIAHVEEFAKLVR